MLTKNHRQEGLCRAYVQAVAAVAGVATSTPLPDYGIDLCLRGIERRGSRLKDVGPQIDVQLKSTSAYDETEDAILYDLAVGDYNHLCETSPLSRRILVVMVLPGDETDWLAQSVDSLVLRRCAYWLSLAGQPASLARRSVRVALPRQQLFTPDAVRFLMQATRAGATPP